MPHRPPPRQRSASCTIAARNPAAITTRRALLRAAGAIVACPGATIRRIAVADDLANAVLAVTTDAIAETFRYDPDTGYLRSA